MCICSDRWFWRRLGNGSAGDTASLEAAELGKKWRAEETPGWYSAVFWRLALDELLLHLSLGIRTCILYREWIASVIIVYSCWNNVAMGMKVISQCSLKAGAFKLRWFWEGDFNKWKDFFLPTVLFKVSYYLGMIFFCLVSKAAALNILSYFHTLGEPSFLVAL